MLFIFFAIILFSLNNVLWKKNLKTTAVTPLMAYRALFTTLFALTYVLFLEETHTITSHEFIKMSIGSLSGALGLFCMLFALKHVSLQWIGIYNLVGVVFTAMYLIIFDNFSVTDSITGTVIIFIGFGLFITSNSTNKVAISLKMHALLISMTFFFAAVSIIHWKNLISEVPPIAIIANQEAIVFITSLILSFKTFSTKELRVIATSKFKPVLLMSLIVLGAFSSSLMGIKVTNPLVSGLLFLASPLTTILLSSYFFKEKVTRSNWLAIVIICLGAYFLHTQTA